MNDIVSRAVVYNYNGRYFDLVSRLCLIENHVTILLMAFSASVNDMKSNQTSDGVIGYFIRDEYVYLHYRSLHFDSLGGAPFIRDEYVYLHYRSLHFDSLGGAPFIRDEYVYLDYRSLHFSG